MIWLLLLAVAGVVLGCVVYLVCALIRAAGSLAVKSWTAYGSTPSEGEREPERTSAQR